MAQPSPLRVSDTTGANLVKLRCDSAITASMTLSYAAHLPELLRGARRLHPAGKPRRGDVVRMIHGLRRRRVVRPARDPADAPGAVRGAVARAARVATERDLAVLVGREAVLVERRARDIERRGAQRAEPAVVGVASVAVTLHLRAHERARRAGVEAV